MRVGVVLPSAGDQFRLTAKSVEIAGNAARRGAEMAAEEFDGDGLEVLFAAAPDDRAAERAATRLAARDAVFALVGGIGAGQGVALARVAAQNDILFFNIGSASDSLREGTSRGVFNVEASAAMYLNGMARWYRESGVRHWFLIHYPGQGADSLVGQAEHVLRSGSGGDERLSILSLPDAPTFEEVSRAISDDRPDLVVLLLDWRDQLEFLARYEAARLEPPVTGFPTPATQTREFFEAVRSSAPGSGTGPRIALWDASLASEPALELNRRFFARWGRPMDASAWAAYQALAILSRSSVSSGSVRSGDLIQRFEEGATFDVAKGNPVSFDAANHQLRQPLYMVRIDPRAEDPASLGEVLAELKG